MAKKSGDKKQNEERDIKNLEKRIEKLKKHLSKNKHDYTTRRILMIKEAKLRKLKNYRKKK
jgi:ribosomal protein S15P/S13E